MTVVAWGEYIRSAQWNGETFNRAYINHDELVRVGALEFQMTSAPNYQ